MTRYPLVTSDFFLLLGTGYFKSVVKKAGIHLVRVIVLSANIGDSSERELRRRDVLQGTLSFKNLVQLGDSANL